MGIRDRDTWVQYVWMVLAVLSIFIGAVLAYKTDALAERMAYSTVGQVGCVLYGVSLMEKRAVTGSLILLTAHTLASLVLFFTVGAIVYQPGYKPVSYTHLDVYKRQILLCGRAGDEVGSIRRDHADNMLRTGSSIRAGTTAVALLGVNDHFTVFEAHCAIFTDIDTGTNAYTSALALSALEALVNSLLAGRTAGESCFAGSMSSAADEGNLLGYFHRSYAQKLADGIDSILIACGTEGSISGLSDSLCTFRTACFSAATQTTAIETGQKRQNLSDESLGLVVIGTHMKSSFY